MYGDTGVIRGHARRLHERAAEIRAEADSLTARAAAVAWTGLAAEAMLRVVRQHADALHGCADEHDRAAAALERHAREVDHVKELISSIERHVLGVLDSAASGVAGLVGHVVPDAVDRWARDFDPPPHGSIAWLDVDVPHAA